MWSSVTTRRKNWERITIFGAFGVISEIQRVKFGVSVTYIFGGKIWGSDMNFRGKIWDQAPPPRPPYMEVSPLGKEGRKLTKKLMPLSIICWTAQRKKRSKSTLLERLGPRQSKSNCSSIKESQAGHEVSRALARANKKIKGLEEENEALFRKSRALQRKLRG